MLLLNRNLQIISNLSTSMQYFIFNSWDEPVSLSLSLVYIPEFFHSIDNFTKSSVKLFNFILNIPLLVFSLETDPPTLLPHHPSLIPPSRSSSFLILKYFLLYLCWTFQQVNCNFLDCLWWYLWGQALTIVCIKYYVLINVSMLQLLYWWKYTFLSIIKSRSLHKFYYHYFLMH